MKCTVYMFGLRAVLELTYVLYYLYMIPDVHQIEKGLQSLNYKIIYRP